MTQWHRTVTRLLTLLASRRPSHTFEDHWAAARDEAEIAKLVRELNEPGLDPDERQGNDK